MSDPLDDAIRDVQARFEELQQLRRRKRDMFVAMGRMDVAERMYGDLKVNE